MKNLDTRVTFFLHISKIHTIFSRRCDSILNGISFTELIVLYYLEIAGNDGLRRVDLADMVGLTASGITRLLLPMEKIGLVEKTINDRDARSTLVMLASGGRIKLEEAMERAEDFCTSIVDHANIAHEIEGATNTLRAVSTVVE